MSFSKYIKIKYLKDKEKIDILLYRIKFIIIKFNNKNSEKIIRIKMIWYRIDNNLSINSFFLYSIFYSRKRNF